MSGKLLLNFLEFLTKNSIAYRVTNGYAAIFHEVEKESDFDILFKSSDFLKMDELLRSFCLEYDYWHVQTYYQGIFAKNYFIYDKQSDCLLNLDLYGELSRQGIKILNENEVFTNDYNYKGVSILSPFHEFIQYFIKKVDKGKISQEAFVNLSSLLLHDEVQGVRLLKTFFKLTNSKILEAFKENDFSFVHKNMNSFKSDFLSNRKTATRHWTRNNYRIFKRLFRPTGISVAFLGPDGSGKSTIINKLIEQNIPFRQHVYFHLKPIKYDQSHISKPVSDPHDKEPYSALVSYFKILFFIFQYNFGWIKNIYPLKIRSSLILFDRYYDDLIVDTRRYRLSGAKNFSIFARYFIPKPDLFFILTSDVHILYKRKQEVSKPELERQIVGYRNLADDRRYFNIPVDREPEEIVLEIMGMLMKKMNERH